MRTYVQSAKLLAKAFSMANERGNLPNFLIDLFTPVELENFDRRLEGLVELLRSPTGKKPTQAQIAKKVGCAVGVIARLNTVLRFGTGSARQVAERILELEKSTKPR